MEIDFTALRFYLDFVAILVAGGAYIYAKVLSRSGANNAAIDEVRARHDKRLGRHADRLTKVETTMENLPNHGNLEKLHARISNVGKDVSNLSATVAGIKEGVVGIKKVVDLLNEHHMRGKK